MIGWSAGHTLGQASKLVAEVNIKFWQIQYSWGDEHLNFGLYDVKRS